MLVRKRIIEQGRLERKAGGLRGAQRPEMSSSVENRARGIATPASAEHGCPVRPSGSPVHPYSAARPVRASDAAAVVRGHADDVRHRRAMFCTHRNTTENHIQRTLNSIQRTPTRCRTLESRVARRDPYSGLDVRQRSGAPAGRRTHCRDKYSDLDGVEMMPAAGSCCLPLFWRLPPSLGGTRRR